MLSDCDPKALRAAYIQFVSRLVAGAGRKPLEMIVWGKRLAKQPATVLWRQSIKYFSRKLYISSFKDFGLGSFNLFFRQYI